MTALPNRFILIASIAGFIVFTGDFLITIVLGFFYPNYDHFRMVMSDLGTSQSPVAIWINAWWIIFGTFFFIFAIGFRQTFGKHKKSANTVMVLIMLFGLCAWICAGLFPIEPGSLETTLAAKLHRIFGGVGYLSIMFVPLAALDIFSRKQSPNPFWLSVAVFALGLITFGLFIVSENAPTGNISSCVGLWQRLFLLNYYVYLGWLSVMMIRLSQRSI